MKTLQTSLLTLTLLVMLGAGSRLAQARTAPAVAVEDVAVRSGRQTRFLASTLQLSAAQQRAVLRSTTVYFEQLTTLGETTERPGLVAAASVGRLLPSPAALQAGKEYEQTLARILTPGQFNAYSWLTRQSGTGH